MSDGQVPQFPGKGGATKPGKPGPTQPVPAWQKAACPLLTAGEIARKQTAIVQLAGPVDATPLKAQACLGPQCMWFASAKRPDGLDVSGCAPVFMLGQMNMLNTMVADFMTAARAGAEAEAAKSGAVPEPSPLTDAADKATETEAETSP